MSFRALHRPGSPFILVNVWDQGGARLMEAMGAEALGTSSAAHAFTLGRADMGQVSRDEALAHAQEIVASVKIPVSGDLENGYADAPDELAETIRLAAEIGLAGCSIEDTSMGALPGDTNDTPSAYDFDLAVERIKAAASAARCVKKDFVLVARADGVMNGFYDMPEALRRLRAFDAAGADCLYVPLPPSVEALQEVIRATEKPVNVLVAGPLFTGLTRVDYAKMGAARLSLGSALARVTHGIMHNAAQEMLGTGGFTCLSAAASGAQIDALISRE